MSYIHLSLGIPVYNQADTIEQTVISVLEQDVAFDEILVVENHSTDGTAERLRKYSDRVRIIQPQQHLSMVQNWNYCVENMNGKWFSLLSGDDLLKPAFASCVKAALAKHQDAALIRTDWEVIDELGNINAVHHQLSVSRITKPPKTWQEQLYGPKVCFAGFAARRDLWKEVGGFPIEFHLYQDWMFWLKLAPLGKFIRVPKVLSQYRSQKRTDIEAQRVKLRLDDEYRYVMDILLDLPWSGSLTEKRIRAVRYHRMIEMLNYLCRYPQIIETEDCIRKLSAWANAAGMTQIYYQWAKNPQTFKPSRWARLQSRIKQAIRVILK